MDDIRKAPTGRAREASNKRVRALATREIAIKDDGGLEVEADAMGARAIRRELPGTPE